MTAAIPIPLDFNRILAQSQDGYKPEISAFVSLLRACARNKNLCGGTRVHDDILRKGLLRDCVDALVLMYTKCGVLEKAKDLFDVHKSRDVFTWTALISGYAQKGKGQDALNYYGQMLAEGLSPDAVTFSSILKACGAIKALDKGEEIHDEIRRKGLLRDNVVLGTALVDMYAKCGALTKAQQVLENLPMRNVVSWTALIAGYTKQEEGVKALRCYEQMQNEGLCPNAVTYMCILKACGSLKALDKGERIHNDIAEKGLLRNNIVLGNSLVDMYATCGALAKARRVLEELPVRDVFSWSSLIMGYAEQNEGEQAWKCFEQMQSEGIFPNAVTFVAILKACGSIGAVDKGEEIHEIISQQRILGTDVVLGNALVDMYAKCGALSKAQEVLGDLPARDAISWNSLVVGYAQQGDSEQAFECYEGMRREGLSPDTTTFSCILKVCGTTRAVHKGEKIYDEITKMGLLKNNVVLGTALVDMYAKFGALVKAQQLLEELSVRNAACWNALIAGYCQEGKLEQALSFSRRMEKEGLSPDVVTFTCILKACSILGAADEGEKIHDKIGKEGLLGKDVILGTAVMDMYAKCGALAKAWQVFEGLPMQDIVAWNALVAGYAQHCNGGQALKCFERMQCQGLLPNAATFSSVLSSCSRVGLLEDAGSLFETICTKYGPDPEHYTCIVDLFARAGHLHRAVEVIEKMPAVNSSILSALLSACRKWGDVNVGQWAFEHAVQVDRRDAATYLLMADIYAAAGMQEDAEKVEALRIENEAYVKAQPGSLP